MSFVTVTKPDMFTFSYLHKMEQLQLELPNLKVKEPAALWFRQCWGRPILTSSVRMIWNGNLNRGFLLEYPYIRHPLCVESNKV